MSDLERRLEDLFMADSRTRRVEQVNVRRPSRVPAGAFAFIGGVAVITLVSILALNTLRGDPAPDETVNVGAGPSASASASSAPSPSASGAGTVAPSASVSASASASA